MTTTRDFAAANAKSLARLAMEPDTDCHAEALMYANCLGKVKDFCMIPKDHHRSVRERYLHPDEICECAECGCKRRILAIIAKGLK